MAEQVMFAISQDFVAACCQLAPAWPSAMLVCRQVLSQIGSAPERYPDQATYMPTSNMYVIKVHELYSCVAAYLEESSTYLLLWAATNESAQQWVDCHCCYRNPHTGLLQVYEVLVPDNSDSSDPLLAPLFINASDDDLLELGLPEVQIPWIRTLRTAEQFYEAKSSLPGDAYENLNWIVAGFPVNEVLELVRDEKIKSDLPPDVIVVVDDEALQNILKAPLEKWRVFLHPNQRYIVNKKYSGPARVLGGAGTGKTVVAMHRAKKLAAALPADQRLLFTTFTANLAADIRENLGEICSLEELRKIEVINLDAWVNQFLRGSGFSAQISYDKIDALWDEAMISAADELSFDTDFYREEWNRIVIPQEALSLEKYVMASRSGRGTQLNRKKRMQIWQVFEAYRDLLKERQILDINTAMYEAAKLLTTQAHCPRYAHIIVDEAQDFSDSAFRLLRALAGVEHSDDIFIVGDSHQRIYHNYPTLSRCGINVRGRSRILKINYRTTEEIRKSAFAILEGCSFDDLDNDIDTGKQCQSLTHGNKPVCQSFPNAEAELKFLVKEIKSLINNGVAPSDICVVSRTQSLVNDYVAQLTQAGFSAYPIKRSKTDNRRIDGLRVATMHRVKGLEFQYVFIGAVNEGILPLPQAISKLDKVAEAETLTAEKCLLYVAMTRAQKGVYITSYGRPSVFLGPKQGK